MIKRVAAVGGERIAFDRRGRAIVDGRLVRQDSVIECEPAERCDVPRAIRVPPGSVFLLGDNRPYSSDSRRWGPVAVEAIEGEVQLPESGAG